MSSPWSDRENSPSSPQDTFRPDHRGRHTMRFTPQESLHIQYHNFPIHTLPTYTSYPSNASTVPYRDGNRFASYPQQAWNSNNPYINPSQFQGTSPPNRGFNTPLDRWNEPPSSLRYQMRHEQQQNVLRDGERHRITRTDHVPLPATTIHSAPLMDITTPQHNMTRQTLHTPPQTPISSRTGTPRFVCSYCSGNKPWRSAKDLERHVKSVHGIYEPGNMYWVCAVPGCARADKKWPRMDNFKQHIERMHPDANLEDIITRSRLIKSDDQGSPSTTTTNTSGYDLNSPSSNYSEVDLFDLDPQLNNGHYNDTASVGTGF